MRIPREALRQSVDIEDYDGESAMGTIFAPLRAVRASVQYIRGFVVNWRDEEVTVNLMILIRPEDGPVATGSRLTYADVKYRVVKAFPIPDDFRPSHWELQAALWGSR